MARGGLGDELAQGDEWRRESWDSWLQEVETILQPECAGIINLRAPHGVMNHATKAIEIEDIEARVTALEETGDQGKR